MNDTGVATLIERGTLTPDNYFNMDEWQAYQQELQKKMMEFFSNQPDATM